MLKTAQIRSQPPFFLLAALQVFNRAAENCVFLHEKGPFLRGREFTGPLEVLR